MFVSWLRVYLAAVITNVFSHQTKNNTIYIFYSDPSEWEELCLRVRLHPLFCVERDSRRRGGISTVSHNTVMYAALEHAATVYGSINVVVV